MNPKTWTNTGLLKAYILTLLITGILVLGLCPRRHHRDAAVLPYTEAQLSGAMEFYSKTIFGGKVPASTRVTWANFPDDMGQTVPDVDGVWHIRIDRATNPTQRTALLTLIHEECHIVTYGQEFDDHGPKFQACMLRAASQGVFANIW